MLVEIIENVLYAIAWFLIFYLMFLVSETVITVIILFISITISTVRLLLKRNNLMMSFIVNDTHSYLLLDETKQLWYIKIL